MTTISHPIVEVGMRGSVGLLYCIFVIFVIVFVLKAKNVSRERDPFDLFDGNRIKVGE